MLWLNDLSIIFLLSLCSLVCLFVSAGCGDPYNRDDHAQNGKLDICSIEEELPEDIKIMINWGSRPVWIDDHRIAFLNNVVGDVYMMDMEQNNVTLLTGHFAHAGFSRVHVLRNRDLLLVGLLEGQLPSSLTVSPYVPYVVGRFNGNMFLLKVPYDEAPYPFNVHAWEGVAVSRQTDRIAWSDTSVSFFGANLFISLIYYLFYPSNLWTGVIVYDENGEPSLTEQKIIHSKGWFDFVFNEPQDFRGDNDEELLFSKYGPCAEGSSDMWIYDLTENRNYNAVPKETLAYNEWEGISPGYDEALFERDPNATRFSGPSLIDMYVWNFASQQSQIYTQFRRSDGLCFTNAVFSPNGRWVLMGAKPGKITPGFTVGIVLIDFEESFRKNAKVLS